MTTLGIALAWLRNTDDDDFASNQTRARDRASTPRRASGKDMNWNPAARGEAQTRIPAACDRDASAAPRTIARPS